MYMDAVLRRSPGHRGLVIKKEELKRDVESNGDIIEEDSKHDFALKIGNGRSYTDEIISDEKKRFSPQKDLINDQVPESTGIEKSSIEPELMASFSRKEQSDDQLESTKAEMDEVREENERLKMYLGKIMKDYQTLQMQFNSIVQQEAAKNNNKKSKSIDRDDSATEETELVSLSLGSFLAAPKANNKDDKSNNSNKSHEKQDDREGLSLGLDCKYISEPSNKSGATDQGGPAVSNPSAESSFEERKEEAGETWPPSKASKPVKRNSPEQDEVSQVQNPVKKARVCVRARCDTPTMNDGCQWRKYGQKIAKGNPCPRAYYRCTVAPSCPVRKQVQRCADDMSILITTYEGNHNHPLPVSATAMASTTSAAASMLLSGSSASSSSTTRPADAHGFNTLDSSKWNNNNNKQFYLPNTSTYSSFQSSHPTITLDLTSTHPNANSSPFLNKFSSSSSAANNNNNNNNNNYHNALLYPSNSLSFGSSDPNTNNMSWSNYGASTQQPYNLKNQIMGSLRRQIPSSLFQNPSNINTYQNYMQHKGNGINNTNPSSGATSTSQVPDITIAAATKAITADPTFQSALAAALTSIIGAGGGGLVGQGNNNILQGEVAQNLKWTNSGDHHHHQQQQQQQVHFPASTGTDAKGNATNCSSTFLNKTTAIAGPATNAQPVPGSLMFLSGNAMSFSASKSASASPGDTRENTS